MPTCRNCGADIDSSYRFCPMCATPQTDEAARRLELYVEKQATAGAADSTTLGRRVSYAVGFVSVVAGIATLTDVGGVFFVLAGLLVLPPVRTAVERRLDQQFGTVPAFGAAVALIALGSVLIALL